MTLSTPINSRVTITVVPRNTVQINIYNIIIIHIVVSRVESPVNNSTSVYAWPLDRQKYNIF